MNEVNAAQTENVNRANLVDSVVGQVVKSAELRSDRLILEFENGRRLYIYSLTSKTEKRGCFRVAKGGIDVIADPRVPEQSGCLLNKSERENRIPHPDGFPGSDH